MKYATILVMTSLLSIQAYAAEINVKVSGMVCSMCAQGIQKKFSNEKSVEKIKVNLDNKLVQILTKDGQNISDEKIKELISEAGYNVAEIERK
ncbi:MAG: heavy-metal-associated domain-containing protein [Bacteriovoracaceae bacterium]|jgi:copper chaperone CopZ|nr:heavy-metal-associated domain-containing protein [Bacteriovoracaceae bacterium]